MTETLPLGTAFARRFRRSKVFRILVCVTGALTIAPFFFDKPKPPPAPAQVAAPASAPAAAPGPGPDFRGGSNSAAKAAGDQAPPELLQLKPSRSLDSVKIVD